MVWLFALAVKGYDQTLDLPVVVESSCTGGVVGADWGYASDWASATQRGWIWQLNSIACQLRQSVPRTRRDDPTAVERANGCYSCSPHTQG